MRASRATACTALLLAACVTPIRFRPDASNHFHARSVTVDGVTYAYQVYVPPGRRPEEKLPVILFLHGGGEGGEDNVKQVQSPLGLRLWRDGGRRRFVVVFPQCRAQRVWAVREMEAQALAALEAALGEWGGDPDRVILTGHSMGGYGTWILAARHPGRFAALVPISGGIVFPLWVRPLPSPIAGYDDPYQFIAARVGRTPVWAFHGDVDPLVPTRESRRMVAALAGRGGDVRYTHYPEVGHGADELAYDDPALWHWMAQQRRR